MSTENETPIGTPHQGARRSKQYGFQPSPYADKKPVTMRLSKEARDVLDASARSADTSITELVEQLVRQSVLRLDGQHLSIPDFPVDRDEYRRNQEIAHAEIARLVAELDATRAKWQATTDSLEVYANDAARFLARAEAAEAEIPRLEARIQATSLGLNPPTTTTSITEKKLVHRFPFASVLKHWPEARRNRYNKLPSMPTEWVNFTLETVYDMLDELE